MSLTKWATVAGLAAILLTAPARDAAANCPNGLENQTVNGGSGANLNSVIAASTPPCTLTVGPGTYSTTEFVISRGITVRSSGGSAATVLVATNFAAVAIWPIGGSCPSGATLDGFTLESPGGGVFVGAGFAGHDGCPGNQVTGVTLRNLVVNAATPQLDGQGIDFHNVQNSVIDSCNIVHAYAHGILIETGSNNNLVMNNTIQQSHIAIGVQSSNDNVIVGNAIGAQVFGGITLNSLSGVVGPGSSRNRIERNIMADGISLTDHSNFNYVGLNLTFAPPGRSFGVGVWVNNASNGTYVFGNHAAGWQENGIDVLTASSTLLVGNTVNGNRQGGIWVADIRDSTIDPAAPAPHDTVLQGNYVFHNFSSSNIFLQGAVNTEASYNYLAAAAATNNGSLAQIHSVGFQLQASATARVFENTVSEIGSRAFVFGDTTNTAFFRNRFLRGTNDPARTDGLNGITYSLVPADVRWDGGSFLGGNHWTEFAAATSNPDPSHPYNKFIGNTNGAPYVDRYPYASESLQTLFIPTSVTVVEPVPDAVMAAGTTKTIHWVARGCTLVNVYYDSGVVGPTLISAGQPNTGYYFWLVPAVAARNDYHIQVVCTDRNGTGVGLPGVSSAFSIVSSDLVLLNPGRATRAANGATLRVAWKASAPVTGVNIFVRSGSGGETQVATNVTGTTYKDITLPAGVSSSSRVMVRIQDPASTSRQDSVDGYFMVRGASGSFTTDLAGLTLQIGSIVLLEWTGPSSAYTVDLDLVGGTTVSIAKNLADFGNYTWFVPDASSTTASVRATFKDTSGNTVTTINSGVFRVARNASAPPPTSSDAAARHDFDGDGKTELTVFRPTNGTWYVRYSSLGYAGVDAFQWGLPGDLPISADFDGDGKIELTVFRPSNGTWYIRYSSLGFSGSDAFQWGLPGDLPIAGDFDNDGKTELTVWRPSNGTWYIRYSSLGYSGSDAFQWGLPGDLPIAGDFDNDGRTELTVWRPANGTWYVRYSSLGYGGSNAFQWGLPADIPLAGDFDNDGRTELTVWRPSNGTWYIRYSSLGYSGSNAFQWGLPGDVPVTGDFDDDGKTDFTVWRPANGTWYVSLSSLGYSSVTHSAFQWGLPGDVMVR